MKEIGPRGRHASPATKFGYNEHLIAMRFLCFRIIDSDVKKYGCNKQVLLHLFLGALFRRNVNKILLPVSTED